MDKKLISMPSIATILTGPSIIHRSACGMGRRAKVEQPFLSSGNRGTDLNLEERCPCGLGQFRVYFPLGESEAFTGHHHFILMSLTPFLNRDKNIERIAKAALYNLTGKSRLYIRSVSPCPVSPPWLVGPVCPICPGCPVCPDDHDYHNYHTMIMTI